MNSATHCLKVVDTFRGVIGALYRTLRSTTATEKLIGLVRRFVRNVRR